jgi:cell division septum initiation protein DivIVA
MRMFRRSEGPSAGSGGAAQEPPAGAPGPLPNLTGDLDSLLSNGPSFRTRVSGYDRLQVDNYVAWVEAELASERHQIDLLLARYGACSAELEISRRLLAQAPKGVDLSAVSDRVREMLRLASDEATAMIEAAREEADHLLAETRVEADARLRKAHEIKELAADTADRMLDEARRDRAEAATLRQRTRTETAELVRNAAAERDRLAGEAAETAERLAAARAELDDLRRRRDDAEASLQRLTDRIEQALALATGGAPDQYLLIDNRVAEERVESMSP